jgi:hypothetical protein
LIHFIPFIDGKGEEVEMKRHRAEEGGAWGVPRPQG